MPPYKQPSIKINKSTITFDISDDKHAQRALRTYMTSLSRSGLCHQSLIVKLKAALENFSEVEYKDSEMGMRMRPVREKIIRLFFDNPERDFVRSEIRKYVVDDENITKLYDNMTNPVDAAMKWLLKTGHIVRTTVFRAPIEGEHDLKKPVKSYAYALPSEDTPVLKLEPNRVRPKPGKSRNYTAEKAVVTTEDIKTLQVLRECKHLKVIFGRPDNTNAQYVARTMGVAYKYFLKVPENLGEDVLLVS